MTSKQYLNFTQLSTNASVPRYITRSQSKRNLLLQTKLANIAKTYNYSNYFHVGPRRDLIKIAFELLDENNSNINVNNSNVKKIARLESELSIAHNKTDVLQRELQHVQLLCDNLNENLEDHANRLNTICEISTKKRSFSEI